MDYKPDIKAKVYLLPTEMGGRKTPSHSGYRPAHRVKPDYLTTAEHRYLGQDELAPGQSCDAFIRFVTPDVYPHSLYPGQVIEFQEGRYILGSIQVIEVYNEILLRIGQDFG